MPQLNSLKHLTWPHEHVPLDGEDYLTGLSHCWEVIK